MPLLDGIQCPALLLKNHQNKFFNFSKDKTKPKLSESGNGEGSETARVAVSEQREVSEERGVPREQSAVLVSQHM